MVFHKITVKKKRGGQMVFESEEVLKRVEKHGDLFAPVLKLKQKLPALRSLEKLDQE